MYGHNSHLGHMTKTIFIYSCLASQGGPVNMVLICKADSEKKTFDGNDHICILPRGSGRQPPWFMIFL